MCWIPLFELILSSAFRESAFLYAGHGSGSKYFGHENMLLLDKAPLSLLMGCSSVKMGMKGRWIRMENAFVLYDFAVSCNCEIEGGILIVDWMSMGCK